MVKYGRLSPAQFNSLKGKPLRVDFERQTEPPGPAPHFAQQLKKWLIAWADANDYNIYSDGLVVRTTIDSRLQTMATQALTFQGNQLQSIANAAWNARSACSGHKDVFDAFIRETPEYHSAKDSGMSDEDALKHLSADRGFMKALCDSKTRVQAAFVAMDPRNGEIKAWVGSRDFTQDPFDHVSQARRQPGSTFKPFVYGAAFEQGAKPDDTYPDQAVEIPLAGGEIWRPSDEDAPSGRPITLRDGLAYSRNRITAQLMESVGPARVARLARAMGVRDSQLDAVPSLALGTSPVTLKEMVSSYGTIANEGAYVAPMLVTRIEDRKGEVLAEFQPSRADRVMPIASAQTLLDVMRSVVNKGTGSAIRTRFGIRADVAGKTGTTQDNADGWFILMHPQLVAGAWIGFNDSRVTLRSDYWGQGAHSALPIVGDFFQRSLRSRLVDPRAKFAEEPPPGMFDTLRMKLRAWMAYLFSSSAKTQTPATAPRPKPRPAPATPAAPVVQNASPVAEASAPTDIEPPQIISPAASQPPILPAPGEASAAAAASAPAGVNGEAPAFASTPAASAPASQP
jgi:penicillin-binding protein 1A